MQINNELILGLVGAFVTLFGGVFAYFQNKNEKKQKKRTEAQKEIGLKKNELDKLKSEKDEAHDALTRQASLCLCFGESVDKLKVLIDDAQKKTVEYSKKEKDLYLDLENLYKNM